MNTETSLAIGGVIGALSKFAMMSTELKGPWMTLWVIAVTTCVFALWGYSHDDFSRATSWSYAVEWANSLVASAAAFHGTEETVKKVTGTGDDK